MINFLGILLTILITLAAIYLLNNLLLIPLGMGLKYYKTESVLVIIGSDLLIVLPMVQFIRMMFKWMDGTVYYNDILMN